ncbi:hypothetical protein [Wolbachia pipientis]|uniref:hypothetical protein n=1 Tax=Wolbachia pipientis TaxID=955 RepID=UPI0025A4A627|nr:hypothetical protein [Wolbachia pipientis]MDM8335328.1 hypothetical protein [Wolbachia pipientis]
MKGGKGRGVSSILVCDIGGAVIGNGNVGKIRTSVCGAWKISASSVTRVSFGACMLTSFYHLLQKQLI